MNSSCITDSLPVLFYDAAMSFSTDDAEMTFSTDSIAYNTS